MQLVFDPQGSDLEAVQISQGARLITFKRGIPTAVNDGVGAGLLKSNPELYRLPTPAELAAATAAAQPAAATQAPTPEAPAADETPAEDEK